MIRASVPGAALVRRLQLRAQRLADRHLRAARRRGRTSWHSPAALWPDFIDNNPES
jgi:hypothetical protein